MYRDPRNSVVRVIASNGQTAGTAFFCLPRRYLVTCAHVIDIPAGSSDVVKLQFSPEQSDITVDIDARVCWQWTSSVTELDVAILELMGDLPLRAVPLAFGLGHPELSATITSYGYSAHNPVFGMPGRAEFVGVTRDLSSGASIYVLQGESIARGFSGAPCLLDSGEVVGVITAITTADAQGRWPMGAFAVPAAGVIALCPHLTVGIPDIVQTLTRHWTKGWEPFQKYTAIPSFGATFSADYIFPRLDRLQREEALFDLQSIAPFEILRDQLESKNSKLIIVLGAPGTGKSRLLAELARALSQDDLIGRSLKSTIPILMTARAYAEARGSTVFEHIAGGIHNDSIFVSGKTIDADMVESLLVEGRYRCLVMIDGADEVADPLSRMKFLRRLASDALHLLAGGHLIILTSRPLGELQADFLEPISISYGLPLLDIDTTEKLSTSILDRRSADFNQAVRNSGLLGYLDTPLLFNLAAALFSRNPKKMPTAPIEIYKEFLEQIREAWDNCPVEELKMVDTLSNVALGSLSPASAPESLEKWLTEIDGVLQSSFHSTQNGTRTGAQLALYEAQAIVNFGIHASGLLYKQGNSVHWSHLLLRDYLASIRLKRISEDNAEQAANILSFNFSNTIWRECLILFLVSESFVDRAEKLILDTKDLIGNYSYEFVVFLHDTIIRGALYSSGILKEIFEASFNFALEKQHEFGSCAALFSDDYGMFWRLLRLQRIPEARAVITRAIDRAKPGSMMSEWPNSPRSRQFTPDNIYGGPLATLPCLFSKNTLER